MDPSQYAGPVRDDRSNWQAVIGPILVILAGLWAVKNTFTFHMGADAGYEVGYRLPALVLACLAVGVCVLGIRRARSTGRGEVLAIVGTTFGSIGIGFMLLDIVSVAS